MTTILTEGLPCFKEVTAEKWCQNKCSLNILLQGSEICCYGKCQYWNKTYFEWYEKQKIYSHLTEFAYTKKKNPQAAGNQISYEERIIPSKIISVPHNRLCNAIFVWHASEKNEKRSFLFGLVQRSKTFVKLFSCEMPFSVFSCSQLGSNCFVKALLKTGTFTLCFLHFSLDRLMLLITSLLTHLQS